MAGRFYNLVGSVSAVVLAGLAVSFVLSTRGARGETSDDKPPLQPSAAASTDSPVSPSTDVAAAAERVNQLLRAAWREAGVRPLEPADPMLVVRRLSLAVCGTIPSLEEIRRLEKLPPHERVAAHLDSLLSDRRFADYFAERLARAFVGTDAGPFLVYRRRRFVYWLSDQIAANRPYDELVRELVAAEGLWTDQPATNFVTARIIENQGPDPIALAARTTRAFLGLRIDCAQCHDHPFADWEQKDFEGLAAFFGHTQNSLTGIADKEREFKVEDVTTKEQRLVEPRLPFDSDATSGEGGRREQLARWITSPKNAYFGQAIANRVWTLMFGQGIVEPVDDLEAEARVRGVLELLGEDFRAHGNDLRRLVRVVAATDSFLMNSCGNAEVTEEQERLFAAFPLTRLRSEQIAGSLVQASSLRTVDAHAHVITRLARLISTNDFIKRYGDAGEEELNAHVGTIPQRLVMMNGEIPKQRMEAGALTAAGRISQLAPTDESRVRTAYLVCLTRLPEPGEESHFVARLHGLKGDARNDAVEDMLWSLINSTEFSWNH